MRPAVFRALPLTVALALVAPTSAFAQECPTNSHPWSMDPGASLFLDADAEPTAAFCGGGAAFNLEVYAESAVLGIQHTTPTGAIANVGAYVDGEELIVTLYVPETGRTFYSGPAWRNADNQFHAAIAEIAPGEFLVGFTDRFGGGIDSYDNENPYLFTDVSVVISLPGHLERLADTDGDGIPNETDICLYDPNDVDLDLNDVPDCLEQDVDGDGVVNPYDVCRGLDDTRDANTNGTPDCVEPDADGDGVPDADDLCPTADDTIDVNGNSIADCYERTYDADLDGVLDGDDVCPTANDSLDTNHNLIPDCVELDYDADLDGVPNTEDRCPGRDDLADDDGSGWADCGEYAWDLLIHDDSLDIAACYGEPLDGGSADLTLRFPDGATPGSSYGDDTSLLHSLVIDGVERYPSGETDGFWSAEGYGGTALYAGLYGGGTHYIEFYGYLYDLDALHPVAGTQISVSPWSYFDYYVEEPGLGFCYAYVRADWVRWINRNDTDEDGVPNAFDACEGDDATGDTDADAICDDLDVCEGDDGLGDTDLDGVCDDLDTCAADPGKTEPGDCGCGTADADADADGVTDCLEEALILDGRRSLLYFDARRPTQSFAQFTGTLELRGGLLAPDLRVGDDGVATASVTVGCQAPIPVYSQSLGFDVRGDSTDNREQWRYRASTVEQATIQFKNSQRYNSARDEGLPSVSADANLGQLRSRYVHSDETRLRFRWNADTALPLTLAVDGVAVLTVTSDPSGSCVEDTNTTCLDGYAVDSSYDVFEIHSGHGERVVDVDYTGDRLGDGNIMAWYADGNPADGLTGLVHSHEAIDDGTQSSVWYNAGGRFDVIVPLAGTGVSSTSTDRSATLALQLGGATTAAAAQGEVTFTDYDRSAGRTSTTWRSREVSEDGDCLFENDDWSCEDED